jgi:hypothetical protein
VMGLKWKLHSVCLDILLILTQDRYTVSRMLFWTHPIKTLGDVGQVESRFSPFGGSVCVGAR